MNSINRFRALVFRRSLALAVVALAGFGAGRPAAAQPGAGYWFAGSPLVFAKAQTRNAEVAVALDDPGLGKFLAKLGASIDHIPGQRFVTIASGDRRAISFTIGEAQFTNGDIRESAPFAPYVVGSTVYLPFTALAKALYVLPVADGATTVLQPQIAALDVRTRDRVTTVTVRAGIPLRFKRASGPSDDRLVLAFSGVASTLDAERRIGGSAEVHGVSIHAGGSVRNPTTIVTFQASPSVAHALLSSDTPNVVTIGFARPGISLAGVPVPDSGEPVAIASIPVRPYHPSGPATIPLLDPATIAANQYAPAGGIPPETALPPPPLAAPVTVTSIDVNPSDAGLGVRIGVSGAVRYEWHRLGDNRWYIDLKDALLGVPARDEQPSGSAVSGLRINQLNSDQNPTVRIALSLASPRHVDVSAADGGLVITVAATDDAQAQRVGAGRVSGGTIVAAVPLAGDAGDLWAAAARKPSHPAVPTNPKLIVIDPGHGGSDFGAVHNGLIEKNLALEISKRLRAVLLARGWQVKMTRDGDADVASPNASAHDELQARCDVANDAGARMFVSVHVNSFPTTEQHGTTTYYYKESDQALANAIHKRLLSIGTTDKGVRREQFYVIHHTTMPASLVETAFISNSDDAALLRSPDFLRRVALAIADGIGDYAASNPAGGTTTNGS